MSLMSFMRYLYSKIRSSCSETVNLIVEDIEELNFLAQLGIDVCFTYNEHDKITYVTINKSEFEEKIAA